MSAKALSTPKRRRKDRCPVLNDPEPDCYCMNLTSWHIQKAFQYCLGEFKQCPVYLRVTGIPGS